MRRYQGKEKPPQCGRRAEDRREPGAPCRARCRRKDRRRRRNPYPDPAQVHAEGDEAFGHRAGK